MKYNRIASENAQPIYIEGKQVAVLRDWYLLDIRKHKDHFIYRKDEWGNIQKGVCIATETLRKARKATLIQVTDIENKIRYTISRTDFDKRSFDFEAARASGYGEQRACFLKYFASNEPKRVNYPAHVEAEPLPKQLSLFSARG